MLPLSRLFLVHITNYKEDDIAYISMFFYYTIKGLDVATHETQALKKEGVPRLLFTVPCTTLHGIQANKLLEPGIQSLAVGDFSMGWMRYSSRPVRP